MFLTGFDSKPLNTLYVDKNLKYHGLIQAFSRTNRILNADKPFGNILCFRNLKQATDQALTLFSNKDEAQKLSWSQVSTASKKNTMLRLPIYSVLPQILIKYPIR